MKAKISPRDIELLSAYLDMQLDSTRRARLEARLRAEPELRQVFEDLRRTRTLLRSLPRVRAPRNFTLTPQMVGRKPAREAPPRRVYPFFQFASALASLLLVAVLLGDFLGVGIAPTPTQSEQPQVMMEAMEALESAEADAKAADSAPPAEPAQGIQELEREEAAAGETDDQNRTLVMPTPWTTPGITTTAPLSQTVSGEPLITLPAPDGFEQEGGLAVAEGQQAQPGRTLWRVAEISLALAALAFGLAAIYLRRTRESGR